MPIKKDQIWIVLPAYNEGPMIGQVIQSIRSEGFKNVLVVNDGSSDNTAPNAMQAGASVVNHPINRGAGAAAQTGISFARRRQIEYVVQMDADGQHHPDDVMVLANWMEKTEADLVVGNRFSTVENNIPKKRIFYNRISNLITNWFCRVRYGDTQSGFRLLNRKAIEQIQLKIDGFGYCSEMLIQGEQIGLRIEEAPIKVSYTAYSMSKGQGFFMGVNTAFNLLWKLIFH